MTNCQIKCNFLPMKTSDGVFNPNVTTDLFMKICTGLDCNLNDICETVSINEKQEKFDANR